MDLLSNAISTGSGRNDALPPVVPVVSVITVTHETHEASGSGLGPGLRNDASGLGLTHGPGLGEEVGVESVAGGAAGGAVEWTMDEEEGGFDEALLSRKLAWRTEFRSLSTLPLSLNGNGEGNMMSASTSMSMSMVMMMNLAPVQGLAAVTPELTEGTTYPILMLCLTSQT